MGYYYTSSGYVGKGDFSFLRVVGSTWKLALTDTFGMTNYIRRLSYMGGAIMQWTRGNYYRVILDCPERIADSLTL